MTRQLDQQIDEWSRKSLKDQLGLLWDELEDESRLMAWWEEEPWNSSLVISASQAKRVGPGRWWAVCFVTPGETLRQVVFSDDRERETTREVEPDARELRRLLRGSGARHREDLADLMASLGRRRDEIDLPVLLRFATHRDREIRYVALGCLSWQPSVANDQLGGWFGEDPDVLVRDLALRFAAGRIPRRTRHRPAG